MREILYDVIIIGGGPAGLSAAQYAARANLQTVVLDKSPSASALSYTGRIENYPGLLEPLPGKELLDRFRDQAIKFGAEYVETQVVGVNFDADIKEVLATERVYKGKTVIIATGSMGRKPDIPGEEKFLGKGVSYCATCDAAFFKGETVCIAGESDEAVKEVDVLTGFAKTVYVIAPSEKLNASAGSPPLNHPSVKLLAGYRIVNIQGNEIVASITIRNTETGEERGLDMAGVFLYLHGSRPVVNFLDAALPLSETSCVVTHRTMETSVPGVYAAGDVACGEVRQVVIASAYGCIAALSAEKFIRQRKRMKYDWGKS
ncbi:MAG: FAD-dependent oxidoreductase [Nitrospiraceae bacterium]|nr:MAG: FAD-dependent oxidoreductase [Nitrospiraceae bacterium]